MAMNNGRRTSGSFRRALNPPLAACHGCSKPHPMHQFAEKLEQNEGGYQRIWAVWARDEQRYRSTEDSKFVVLSWLVLTKKVTNLRNRVKLKCNTRQHVQNKIVEAISHISATLCLSAFSWSGTSLRNGVRASLGQHWCFHYLDHRLSKISPVPQRMPILPATFMPKHCSTPKRAANWRAFGHESKAPVAVNMDQHVHWQHVLCWIHQLFSKIPSNSPNFNPQKIVSISRTSNTMLSGVPSTLQLRTVKFPDFACALCHQ